MQSIALVLAIGGTVGYHLVTKLVPAGANPIAMLFTAYVVGMMLCAAILLVMPAEAGFRSHFAQVNWTAPALAMSIVVIDLAFILLYRSGFPLSIGALVTQVSAAIALLGLGYLFFRDRLSVTNIVGVALCFAGLWLVNRD
jgi:drug/metabolite transporter (DMT)-like permease